MRQICPCCKRALPQPKQAGIDKKLMQDLAKAQRSIDALNSYIDCPDRTSLNCEGRMSQREREAFVSACRDEVSRLERAKRDYRLLWAIYRRADKGTSYAVPASIEEVAA